MSIRAIHGDCRDVLKTLASESVHCVVTSPPYFGLRDYGVAGQIGLEATPDAYVAELVAVFREVRRVMRRDATAWINVGDSYGAGKQLQGIPWRVAFALQADGWILRQDIIWSKPNPMPESVRDRCTKAHEYLFLLSKSPRYFYDAEAIAEASVDPESYRGRNPRNDDKFAQHDPDGMARTRMGFAKIEKGTLYETRNRRSVWHIATEPFPGSHFATFPPALIEPCIKAGCPRGGVVLDPFGGAGTTGLVADRLGRDAILIELNEDYSGMSRRRITDDAPLFAEVLA